MAPIQFTQADYLFTTRVEGREFSLHFIELKIIGYQASVNICESRRFMLEKTLCHGTHGGTESTLIVKRNGRFLVLQRLTYNSAVLKSISCEV